MACSGSLQHASERYQYIPAVIRLATTLELWRRITSQNVSGVHVE